jgi:hypothetical protein
LLSFNREVLPLPRIPEKEIFIIPDFNPKMAKCQMKRNPDPYNSWIKSSLLVKRNVEHWLKYGVFMFCPGDGQEKK